MPLFRKRPVVVEARQLAGGNAASLVAWITAEGGKATACNAGTSLGIETLEGTMHAAQDDWVIKGVKREFYPCKDEIFRATYEPAGDLPAPADGSEAA